MILTADDIFKNMRTEKLVEILALQRKITENIQLAALLDNVHSPEVGKAITRYIESYRAVGTYTGKNAGASFWERYGVMEIAQDALEEALEKNIPQLRYGDICKMVHRMVEEEGEGDV